MFLIKGISRQKVFDFAKLEYLKKVLDFYNIEYHIAFLIDQIRGAGTLTAHLETRVH